jgi:protein TonB
MMRAAKPGWRIQPADEPLNSVNDNSPGSLAGHDLSDMPLPSAADDAATHSEIDRFPLHPHFITELLCDAPAMDAPPEAAAPGNARPGRLTALLAGLGSLLVHAIAFAAVLLTAVVAPLVPEEQAGEVVSVIMLGDSDVDQRASGVESKEPEVQPETVVAEAVQPESFSQPTVVDAVETVQPVEPVAPEATQQVAPEAVASIEPEVLTSSVPAETAVQQPTAIETVTPTETLTAAVSPPPPEVEPVEMKPFEKPVKQVEKPRDTPRKQPPKKVSVKAGSGGEGARNSRRGSSDGLETANADTASQSNTSGGGEGSAAVANYPGKVQSRIHRSVKVPSEYKQMTQALRVRVRLTVGSGGELSGLQLARSSGIPELDQSVLAGVRSAAPFPPLPPEWRKPSWTFTQEVQVTGR